MLAKINADNNHPSVHSLTSQYLINLQGPTCCYVNGKHSWMMMERSEIKLDE